MVEVKHEGKDLGPPYERCCVCRKPTPYWYEPNDVALCQDCAKAVEEKDIPTKDQWFANEEQFNAVNVLSGAFGVKP